MKFLIIPILLSPWLMACGPCASTNTCAEEWAKENEEDKFLHPETCQDQRKYDSCVEQFNIAKPPSGVSVSRYCYEQAEYRCADRKSSSSTSKWKK